MIDFTKFYLSILFILGAIFCSGELYASSGEVTKSGRNFVATVDGETVYNGRDFIFAIQAAANNLTAGRSSKEIVRIKTSGSTGRHSWDGDLKAVNIPSFTILDFEGNTMDVNDDRDNTIVPIRGQSVSDIEIRNMRITGNPRYGMWIQSCENVTLSQIHISIPKATSIGLGIRIDDHRGPLSKNVSIDYVYVENSQHHAVETYGVDGINIGTVETRDTGGCGLLLNYTANATVGTVNAYRASNGGGYAAFRAANHAGPNITVDKVIARECGRGVFAVSGSYGITINSVDIEGSTSHGMLIENTQDFLVKGGIIANCGAEGVRITSRSDGEFLPSQYVTVENLRVSGCTYGVRETLPYTNHNSILNNDLRGNETCLYYEGEGTVATGNDCGDGGTGAALDGTYMIVARHSDKVLEVYASSTDNGGNVVQWTNLDGENQQWTLSSVGDGYYQITNVLSGKALEVYGQSTENGGNIVQWDYLGGTNQQWKINDLGDGYYSIINRGSGKAVDIEAISSDDGANVLQWDYSGGYNQQFSLMPVTDKSTTTTTARKAPVEADLEGEEQLAGLTPYPNPTTGSFSIKMAGEFEYMIYDQVGRVMEQGKAKNNLQTGDDLNAGIYLIRIRFDQQISQFKLIKE